MHFKICTYNKKYNKDVKHICTLLITKPKSKSQRNNTKYQFVHIKQLKKSHAKQTPQIICIHIKNPKLNPTPYIRNKHPEVKRPFLLSPLFSFFFIIFSHFFPPKNLPPKTLSRPPKILPPLPCSSLRSPSPELFQILPPQSVYCFSLFPPPSPPKISPTLPPPIVFPFLKSSLQPPLGPKASLLPRLSSSSPLCPSLSRSFP